MKLTGSEHSSPLQCFKKGTLMTATRYAFFDVDETLIGLKSMFSFRDFYLQWSLGPSQGATAQQHAKTRMRDWLSQGLDRVEINRLFWEDFQGFEQADVRSAAAAWHEQMRARPGYFIVPTLQALQCHQTNGVEPVFVSGSSTEILEPLAAELGVNFLLSNRLEVEQGRFTGKLLPPQTIGLGKRQAILNFLQKSDAIADECFGYGDHLSDLPLLESIGHPHVVEGNPELVSIARERGWPILMASSRA